MTLKEKFYKAINLFSVNKNRPEQCEKIADEFAIGFAEWKDIDCIYYDGWHIIVPLGDKYNDVYTNEELLEIYKKEKGL
jgi:hypothetical protein